LTYCEPGSSGTEEEVQAAEEKFNESKLLAEAAMHNLLENDVRVICDFNVVVRQFVDTRLNYCIILGSWPV